MQKLVVVLPQALVAVLPQAIAARQWTWLVMLWAVWAAPGPARAAELASTASTLADRLRMPVAVYWSGDPLRRAVTTLCTSHGVAVVIDRRVDPDRPVDLRSEELTLGQVLRQLADSEGLGITALGPVVYLGPPRAAAVLREVSRLRREEAGRLPPGAAQRWLRAQRLQWDDLSEPRDLVGQMVAQAGLRAAGLEHVPHDLWAGAELPPLSLVDRLTLVAIQFDLTFSVSPDGQTVTLVPLPEELLAETHKAAKADRPAGLPAPGRGRAVPGKGRRPAEVRFTQKPTQGPVGVLLKQIADKLGLELRIDHQAIQAAGLSLDRTVSFQVEQATLDELLDAALSPAGLTFRRTGKVVEVVPAGP